MNWVRIRRFIEIGLTTIFCSFLVYAFYHYLYNVPYIKIIGLVLAYIIYRIAKFISIRNKRLFIKNN